MRRESMSLIFFPVARKAQNGWPPRAVVTPRAEVGSDQLTARVTPESRWPAAPLMPWQEQQQPIPSGPAELPETQLKPAPGSPEFPGATHPLNQMPTI